MTPVPRPLALLAELTYRCPLQCPYCSNPLNLARYRKELETADWLRVLEEAAELGAVHVHFSGGEPLLRPDLEELIGKSRELGLYSNLSTGATLADGGRLGSLREAGLDSLQISLLDADAQNNDYLAGRVSFSKKRDAVLAARRVGFPVTLNIVLHRKNLDHIEAILDLALELEVERVELAHAQYTGWAFRNRAALMPTRSQVDRAAELIGKARSRCGPSTQLIHVLPDYFQEFPKACVNGWGNASITIAPDGVALPCQTAREIPGMELPNVRDQSLSDIWFRSADFEKFRGSAWMPEPCRSCDRREVDFGGCRCQAFLITGDAAQTDPVCSRSPRRALVDAAITAAEGEPPDLIFRRFEN